ncbi:MAG TPA: hypothetical protein VE269_02660 [Gaiellaceae bacterium]|nr:hypothetical protein [Gaiellaceae bacterium]
MRRVLAFAALALLLGGCGSGGPAPIKIGAAREYRLVDFAPATLRPDRPQRIAFVVDQPSGAALTRYRTGPGPHTGVHLIFVRSDLGAIIHLHPKPAADGRISTDVTFPTPGRYRMIVDVYPASGPTPNFQLPRWLTVAGTPVSQPLPPFDRTVTVDGYRFTLKRRPNLHAIQASFLTFTVTDVSGRPARFTPWFGALAHAIFFRAGTLDYFHTHVCGAGTSGCTSFVGGPRVFGTSTKPGVLRVGVLVPVAGTWRLFLQCKVNGRVLTAPFTLTVR